MSAWCFCMIEAEFVVTILASELSIGSLLALLKYFCYHL